MRMRVPAPAWVTVPVPEIVPKSVPCVIVLLRLNESAELLVMPLLDERDPLISPAPICKVPALIVVIPVWLFAPVSTSVPVPVLLSAPVVAALLPLMVNVVADVETSMVPVVAAPRVNERSVDEFAPVYCRVPPLRTKLVAAFDACPKLPATLPLLMVATERMPFEMVVIPVKVFAPLRVTVPAVVLLTAPVPARMAEMLPL